MGSIQSRYPSKLAGLFTTRLGYDATTLGLNGENGILFEERKGIPVDTPITDLNWERPAFSGNALRLDFRRLVTDSVSLEFGLAATERNLRGVAAQGEVGRMGHVLVAVFLGVNVGVARKSEFK